MHAKFEVYYVAKIQKSAENNIYFLPSEQKFYLTKAFCVHKF